MARLISHKDTTNALSRRSADNRVRSNTAAKQSTTTKQTAPLVDPTDTSTNILTFSEATLFDGDNERVYTTQVFFEDNIGAIAVFYSNKENRAKDIYFSAEPIVRSGNTTFYTVTDRFQNHITKGPVRVEANQADVKLGELACINQGKNFEWSAAIREF